MCSFQVPSSRLAGFLPLVPLDTYYITIYVEFDLLESQSMKYDEIRCRCTSDVNSDILQLISDTRGSAAGCARRPNPCLVVLKPSRWVAILSYRFLGKCRLDGSWLHCGVRRTLCQARECRNVRSLIRIKTPKATKNHADKNSRIGRLQCWGDHESPRGFRLTDHTDTEQ